MAQVHLHMNCLFFPFPESFTECDVESGVLEVYKVDPPKCLELTGDEVRIMMSYEKEFNRIGILIAVFENKTDKKTHHDMSPVKRICLFEHSVMTNFNCAYPAIQRGQGSGFLSVGSS